MDIIFAFLVALFLMAFGIALVGALYGAGLWGIWWILAEVGVLAVSPMWWPCFGIGCILTLLFGTHLKFGD